MGNSLKTTLLLGLMTVLVVWIGNLLGGRQGMIIAFILAIAMNFFSYWYSDKIVLKMYRAKKVTPQQRPDIYEMVRFLAGRAAIPVPKIYIIPEDAPNAFATGRNPENAVVAVTEGLLSLMDRDEIMGVIAHEMAHIKNRDILIGSIAATMAGAIMILASMARWSAFLGGGSDDDEGGGLGMIGLIVMSILAPMAAMLVQMAISRAREYHADQTGSSFVGQPGGLANALGKLGAFSKKIPLRSNPNTAHMFIVNPLSGGGITALFSTHPPLEERIARLTGAEIKTDHAPDKDRGLKNAADFWNNLK